jgi:hypothetical protein
LSRLAPCIIGLKVTKLVFHSYFMILSKVEATRKKYPLTIFTWACLALLSSQAMADDEWIIWKSTSGSKVDARYISHSGDQVIFEKRDGTRITAKISQLATSEQDYILSLGSPSLPTAPAAKPTPTASTEPDILAIPGKTTPPIKCQADPKWSYVAYFPKAYDASRAWPVCFIMSPNGGGQPGALSRYIRAAEHLGVILALSSESKNGFADSEVAVNSMVKDVYTRFPILNNFSIASGMSGGSRMAYLLAETEKNVAGVLACGSGAGVYPKDKAFRTAMLRPNTVICSLLGSNDYNRREAVESHKDFNKNSRFIWFIGAHDWAADELIMDGMSHIYGKILMTSKEPGLDVLRAEFATNQLAWVKTQTEISPALAQRWAAFLSQFPGNTSVQQEATEWLAALNQSPDVILAMKAEKVIDSFSAKYFSDGDTVNDKNPDDRREKDALRKASEFKDLPQAELLTRMGGCAFGG